MTSRCRADLEAAVGDLANSGRGVRWSICVIDVDRNPLASADPDCVLATASVGKLLLLIEIARQIERGDLAETKMLDRRLVESVADSGLWQHLTSDALPVADLAALVASVSDNLATNVLLEHIGLAQVQRVSALLRLRHTRLLDRVRSDRRPTDAPHLSEGSARELADLMIDIARGELLSHGISDRMYRWLSLNTDLSMVAGALNLDPLAHVEADRDVGLFNKTGTDADVRADVGFISGATGSGIGYAVIANWDEGADQRDWALERMAAIGSFIRACIEEEKY